MNHVPYDNKYALILSEKRILPTKIIPAGSLLKIETTNEDGTHRFSVEMDTEDTKFPKTYVGLIVEDALFFSPEIFKFVISIEDPKNRIKFCKSIAKRNFISQLKVGDSVKIPHGSFTHNDGRLCRAFVKYIGILEGKGPGHHFIVSLMRRDWCFVTPTYNDLISRYVEPNKWSIILSAEYIYKPDDDLCPEDVELFHLYRGKLYNQKMNRHTEPSGKITKEQAYNKRNSSNVFESATNNKNTSKTVPEKPFNVNGKDIYVIDAPSDSDTADVQIVKNNQYEDRSAGVLKTTWPAAAGPIHEMTNYKPEDSSSSGANYTKTNTRSSTRQKSSNLLDHFNHDAKNANRDVAASGGGHSKYSLRRHMDYGYGYDMDAYIPLTVFEHFDWDADQSAVVPQYIIDEPRESVHNYDNDVNHTIDVEDPPETFSKIPGSTLGLDAMVTVETGSCEPVNGVIRAIFKIGSIVMVGVELEDFISYVPLNLTDGTFSGHRFFQCQNGKALFIEAECCHKDNRFSDDFVIENKVFGHPESPVITEVIPPISLKNLVELEEIIGESKGIQGHNNSCYLDATLFSMFTFAQCFDSLLYRAADKKDIQHYDKVRAILRDEIVHPLRKHHFVRADRVLKLRELLEEISTMTGLTNEEKDPEEFMNILMAQTLRADPYLKFNSGQDAFYYQLFVEKNDDWILPNVQQLFEQSFKTSNIKLREVPPSLIIQMPRFGKNYKMYPRIVPSQVLDITDVVEGQPPACVVCAALGSTKCLDCDQEFCNLCFTAQHQYKNTQHKGMDIRADFPTLQNHQTVPRIHMDLFAVVCIETSHYVSFVKAGELPDAPWLFFDSMSDRRGGQNGYNIPSMVSVPDLPEWLSEEGARKLHDSTPKDKLLPPFAKRLLCDAYMCMYVSRDVSMYK